MASAFTTYAAGLVPCDVCTPCDLWELAYNIVWFLLFSLALPILTVAILAGGVMILVSAGNQSLREKGKALIWNAVIGILIAFTAYLIINTIIATLATGKFTAGWNSISGCQAVGTSGGITPPTTQPTTTTGTPTPTPTGGKQCSASSVSSQVTAIINCVIPAAKAAGLNVPQPSPNQLNAGCHACQSPNVAQGSCSNSGIGISCHYGGSQCTGVGNAVDFGLPTTQWTPANWQKLDGIIANCGAASKRCERGSANVGCSGSPDHIHVNASGSCGCN